MSIQQVPGATIITGEDILGARLLVLRRALMLEASGLRHSRGSMFAMVKKQHNLKGNREKVFGQFNDIVTEKTGVPLGADELERVAKMLKKKGGVK